MLKELRGLKELTVIPWPVCKTETPAHEAAGWQKSENSIAVAIEKVLKKTIFTEKKPGDELGMATKEQAEKGEKRDEILRKHAEWQKVKRRR